MSANTQHRYLNLSLAILALIAIGSGQGPLHATPPGPCASPVPLTPIETWRDSGGHVGNVACFEVVLDDTGILMFNVSTSATAARARLMSFGTEEAVGVTRLQQSATSLILAAERGSYQVRVETEDPRQLLPPFILSTRFTAGPARSETDSETEVDPDPFAGTHRSETDSETEVDPDPFAGTHRSETDSETEVDPDPFAITPVSSSHDLSTAKGPLHSRLAELCRQGETDDHDDSFACATALGWGHQVAGEISNGWGDDSDVFRFRVEALGPVEIQAHGAAPKAHHHPELGLAAELYDRHSQRLDVAIGRTSNLRLVRTLAPGTYFVRLEGLDGAAGRYSLSVAPPSH